MKSMTVIGVTLIVLGIFTLVYKSFTYTTQEKIFEVGSLEATAARDKTIPLSPILGGIALVGGIVLVITGSKMGVRNRNLEAQNWDQK